MEVPTCGQNFCVNAEGCAMDWRKRSVVERVKAILEGHYEPDPSSSLLISLRGTGPDSGSKDEMYWDMHYRVFPLRLGIVFDASNLGEGFVVALREAINAMSLPGYVRVEAIDDNSLHLGRLHGMRRVSGKKSVADRCMEAFLKTVNLVVHAGIEGFINLHFLVVAIALVIAAMTQNDTLTAISTVALSLTILKDNDWRSLQKQRLARLVHEKEGGEREANYRKRLHEECNDPDDWNFTKVFVHIRICNFLLDKVIDRCKE